eukprot:GHVQ01043479.1.p1 GENE.GHVQ01043479.1~~GHVQ01043479.1.p1  ORF type:complete len:448 (-),score=81.92 GHVQ01043479.1:282-1625(-)
MRSSHSTPMASHSSSSSSVDGGESHCHATKLYVNKTDDIICFLDYVLDILYSVRPSSTTPILHVRGHVGIPQKGRTLDVNISTQTSAVSGEGAKYGWRVEEEVKGMGVSVKTREEDEGNSVDRSDVSMEMSLRQDIHSLLSEHDTFLCRDKQSEDVKKENKITMEGEGKDEKGRVKVRKEGGVDDMSVIENAVHQSECVEVDCLIKLVMLSNRLQDCLTPNGPPQRSFDCVGMPGQIEERDPEEYVQGQNANGGLRRRRVTGGEYEGRIVGGREGEKGVNGGGVVGGDGGTIENSVRLGDRGKRKFSLSELMNSKDVNIVARRPPTHEPLDELGRMRLRAAERRYQSSAGKAGLPGGSKHIKGDFFGDYQRSLAMGVNALLGLFLTFMAGYWGMKYSGLNAPHTHQLLAGLVFSLICLAVEVSLFILHDNTKTNAKTGKRHMGGTHR